MELKEVFVCTIKCFYLHHLRKESYQNYDNYPTKEEIINQINFLNQVYPESKDLRKTVNVEKILNVIEYK